MSNKYIYSLVWTLLRRAKEYIIIKESIFQILDISKNNVYVSKWECICKLVVTSIEEQSILNKRVKLCVSLLISREGLIMFEQKFISESICFEWTSLNGYHVYLLDTYIDIQFNIIWSYVLFNSILLEYVII